MKYVKQFLWILMISFAGEILHTIIPLPIPSSIYGIVILFCGLKWGVIPLHAIEETGRFLIEAMPVMFIPAAAGLVDSWGILQDGIVKYLILTVVSTMIVLGVSGRITQRIILRARTNKKEERK